MPIDDPADPRISVFQGLRDHQLRQLREADGGDMSGVFVAEGDLVVERAIDAGYGLCSILVDGARRKAIPPAIEAAGAPIYGAAPNVLQHITGYHLHRGLLACFHRRPLRPVDEVLATSTTLLVLEGINNPTNLGVILRCGVALGVDAFVMDHTCSDPLYRRAGRVSMGEAYRLPYARLGSFPDNLAVIHDSGFTTLALTPSGDTDIGDLSFGADQRVALVLGSEGPGLSDGTIHACSMRVRIPMSGSVDSLNVGSAASVAFYAIQQARTTPSGGPPRSPSGLLVRLLARLRLA
ncbi:MAG: RNA methyltransferase [Acidimicrobiales bacterium]|nr:RNA methyltransferase [Acidimicrobiales bacterium]